MVEDDYVVSSMPVPELNELENKKYEIPEFEVNGDFNLTDEAKFLSATFEMDMLLLASDNIEVQLSNENGDHLSILYDKTSNAFIIDRSKTGDTSFHPEFDNLIHVPRASRSDTLELKLVVDVASIELFSDNGTTVTTAIFFPEEVLDRISLHSDTPIKVSDVVLKDII